MRFVRNQVGHSSALANLHGRIENDGGGVTGVVAPTGKPCSANLNLGKKQLHELKQENGRNREKR